VAYLLEQECGIYLPKDMIREFGTVAGKAIDALGREVTATDFAENVVARICEKRQPYKLKTFHAADSVGEGSCLANIGIQWRKN